MIRSPPMLVVGLTGGIGAGKSTVSRLLAALGAVIVDADAIAREVVEPDGPAYQGVVDRFGGSVLVPDGHLDRAALAAIVFSDLDALKDLNAIVHPAVGAVIAERLADRERPVLPEHEVVLPRRRLGGHQQQPGVDRAGGIGRPVVWDMVEQSLTGSTVEISGPG